MKRHLFLIFFIITAAANAQYAGGDDDGFSLKDMGGAAMSDQSFYTGGGNNDGFFVAGYSGYAFDQEMAFGGGDNDGESFAWMIPAGPLNDQEFYCSSGDDDGFDVEGYSGYSFPVNSYVSGGFGDGFSFNIFTAALNEQGFYCSSGDDDGFSWSEYEGYAFSPLAFQGGNADGFSHLNHSSYMFDMFAFAGGEGDGGDDQLVSGQYLGYGIWTGLTDQDWDQASNWKHNTLPASAGIVTIPSGCPNYPLLSSSLSIDYYYGAYRTSRMDILPGGTITTHDMVNVSGELNVWGTFNSESSTDRLIRVLSGGIVLVDSSGNMLLGKQTVGPALTDMVVYNGGELILKDGTLEIDDQLNIMSGGKLDMSGGELFAHKFGEGSTISDWLDYGPFYIASGATGGISGGTVMVTGKPSAVTNSAIQISEPSFSFTGNSVLTIRSGVSSNLYSCGLSIASGATLNTLMVKDGKNLEINSDVTVLSNLEVQSGSEVKVSGGYTLSVGN